MKKGIFVLLCSFATTAAAWADIDRRVISVAAIDARPDFVCTAKKVDRTPDGKAVTTLVYGEGPNPETAAAEAIKRCPDCEITHCD